MKNYLLLTLTLLLSLPVVSQNDNFKYGKVSIDDLNLSYPEIALHIKRYSYDKKSWKTNKFTQNLQCIVLKKLDTFY